MATKFNYNSSLGVSIVTGIGAMFAYYDFCIFGLMAAYLAEVFFPGEQTINSVETVYFLFSIAYFARPIGGIFFGLIGDRYGRSAALVSTMVMMSISTILIGILPSYHEYGFFSAFLLVMLRLLQGFAFGAELPGGLTLVAELSNKNKLSFYCGIVMAVNCFGGVAGSFVLYLLSVSLEKEEIVSWGWRIPFLLGGVSALFSVYLQKKIVDPIKNLREYSKLNFKYLKELTTPVLEIIYNRAATIVLGIILTAFFACLVLLGIYFCTYLPHTYGYQSQDIYLARTISRTFACGLLIVVGIFVDRIGSGKIVLATLVTFILLTIAYVIFDPLQAATKSVLMIFFFAYEGIQAVFVAAYIPLIVKILNGRARFTGMAICYNFGFSLSSLLPISFSNIIDVYDEPLVVFIIPSALAVICIITLFFYANRNTIAQLLYAEKTSKTNISAIGAG